jgi:phosphoglucosamine mutase
MSKKFGTDGIRGPVGGDTINPEFMLKLGWAVGKVLCQKPGDRVLIGKDTRISGYMLESALEAGLSAAGMSIQLLGPLPTPGIAYLTRTLRAAAGIVISASHNAYGDNGIKFFSGAGAKLTAAHELAIEAAMHQPMTMVDSAELGKAERIEDAVGRYAEFCKQTVPEGFTCAGLTVVVDCAHGANYQVAPIVLSELGAKVIIIGAEPDGLNINEGYGSTHPERLQQAVLSEQADVGIAFDGDGDRLIMVDHHGCVVDGDECLYVMVAHALNCLQEVPGVVGTAMSNEGLVQTLSRLGVDFYRADVGDKHVLKALQARDWLMGGEPSGHLIHLGKTTTGDGLIAALQVLQAIVETGCSLADLRASMTRFPQVLINVAVAADAAALVASDRMVQAVSHAQSMVGAAGRVLVRPSGTEPLVRVMVEGEDSVLTKNTAEELASVISSMVTEVAC